MTGLNLAPLAKRVVDLMQQILPLKQNVLFLAELSNPIVPG